MLYGFDLREALEKARTYRYACVFYFEPLPYQQDAVRVEDGEMAVKLDVCFRQAYKELGYEPVHVPVMSIAERGDFLVRHLRELGIYSA